MIEIGLLAAVGEANQLTVGELITIGTMIASVTTVVISNRNSNKTLKEDIMRLEKKQDKYNNLQERTAKLESKAESAHHRIDDSKTETNRIWERVDEKLENILNAISEHVEKFHSKKED